MLFRSLQGEPHRSPGYGVRDTRAPHVVVDDPAHRAEPVEEAHCGRLVPDCVHVGERAGDEHDVALAGPEDLICQVSEVGLNVPGLRATTDRRRGHGAAR